MLVDALGVKVRIRGDDLDEATREAVAAAWRDALVPSSCTELSAGPDAGDGGEQGTGPDAVEVTAAPWTEAASVLSELSQRVTLAAIERQRGRLWMLHAAGLASSDGRVVALVGPSGRGKTTAARALGSHLGYVSDETVAVDEEGRVWPYRKPLSVIEEVNAPKVQRSPSELHLRELPESQLRLAALVLLERAENADVTAVVEPVDLADALSDLVMQSSYLTTMPAPLRTIANHAVETRVLRVRYRDAESLVAVLDQLLARTPQHSPLPGREADEGVGLPRSRGDAREAALAEGIRVPGGESAPTPTDSGREPVVAASGAGELRYRRTRTHDVLAFRDPDRLALLKASEELGTGDFWLLAGIAPTLWRAADGATLAELTVAAVAAHGAPPGVDPEDAVAAVVEELTRLGVLRAV